MVIFLNLIILLTLFTSTYKVEALEYYNTVDINTYFDESIDVDSISKVQVCLTVNEEDKYYDLNYDADFKMSISGVTTGELVYNYGIVDDDYVGVYKVTANVEKNDVDNTVQIDVYVSLQNNTTHTIYSTEAIKNIRNGEDNTTNTSTNTNETTTTSQSNGNITIDNDESTTTTTKIENEEIVEDNENRKKNDIIFIIIYGSLGICLLIVLFIAFVNIIKANK